MGVLVTLSPLLAYSQRSSLVYSGSTRVGTPMTFFRLSVPTGRSVAAPLVGRRRSSSGCTRALREFTGDTFSSSGVLATKHVMGVLGLYVSAPLMFFRVSVPTGQSVVGPPPVLQWVYSCST
ncbi:unnamed protein product [Nesidiocoris tenuis]|uniref:Uncharacterized protein n=1 Tax=Nesidiocoris tenuis TaxID=355587 RepID=A0A6H5FW21_9HEMI|nr:unnamed protein product [Nesidiocoris tenuis]